MKTVKTTTMWCGETILHKYRIILNLQLYWYDHKEKNIQYIHYYQFQTIKVKKDIDCNSFRKLKIFMTS